jgi:hypothetical protein
VPIGEHILHVQIELLPQMNPVKACSSAGGVRFFAASAAVMVDAVAKSDRMYVGLVAVWTCGTVGKEQCFFFFT